MRSNPAEETWQSYPALVWTSLEATTPDHVKEQIERNIQGAQVIWVQITYNVEVLNPLMARVTDFEVEAVVKNVSANLTGLEVVVVIVGIGMLATIITALAIGSWVTYEVVSAAKRLGDPVVIGVGLVIFVLVGIFLLVIFGRRFSVGKKGVQLGK